MYTIFLISGHGSRLAYMVGSRHPKERLSDDRSHVLRYPILPDIVEDNSCVLLHCQESTIGGVSYQWREHQHAYFGGCNAAASHMAATEVRNGSPSGGL